MKKFTLIISLIISCNFAFGQIVISNGEDTGLGWWQAGSTAVEIVDWHPKEGNPTAKAMTIWISPTSDAWSGGGLGGLNINVSAYNKISVLVYKNVVGTVRLELQDGGPNQFVTANYTTPGVWQKLEFAIPAGMGNITTLLIAPFIDYNLSTIVGEQSRCFWDEVIAFKDTTANISNSFPMSEVFKYEFFSITGILIKTFNNSQEISYSDLAKGFYIIKQTNNAGKNNSFKVSIK
ncbi:MAG: T9SS type A sorting domain-containing protein [Paludibacteraceae bacterium]